MAYLIINPKCIDFFPYIEKGIYSIEAVIDYDKEHTDSLLEILEPPYNETIRGNSRVYKLPNMGVVYVANQILNIRPEAEVIILDNEYVNLTQELAKIDLKKIQAVFLTANSSQFPNALKIAKFLHDYFNIPAVFGGIHVSARPQDVNFFVDFDKVKPSVVIGGADKETITGLLADLDNKKYGITYDSNIMIEDGIFSKGRNFNTLQESKEFGFLFRKFNYYFLQHVLVPFCGCPFRCKFCSTSSFKEDLKKSYRRSIPDIIKEIELKYRLLKGRLWLIACDNILLDRDYFIELFKELKNRKIHINYVAQCSVDIILDKEFMQFLVDHGCVSLFIGYESLDINNLKSINKLSAFKVLDYYKSKDAFSVYKKSAQEITKKGLSIIGSFMFGLDFDYYNDKDNNSGKLMISFLRQAPMAIQFNPMKDLPGAILFEESIREGTHIFGDPNQKNNKYYPLLFSLAADPFPNRKAPEKIGNLKNLLQMCIEANIFSSLFWPSLKYGILLFYYRLKTNRKSEIPFREKLLDALVTAIVGYYTKRRWGLLFKNLDFYFKRLDFILNEQLSQH